MDMEMRALKSQLVHGLLSFLCLAACASPPALPPPPPPSSLPPPSTLLAPSCELPAPTETIAVEEPIPGEVHELFDLSDDSKLWAPAPFDGALAEHREKAAAELHASVDPIPLLQRQLSVMATLRKANQPAEADNIEVLLNHEAGTIGPITCLEAMLWKRQARRYDMLAHPTEFGAFVLRKAGRVRVYMSGADRVGGKIRHEITGRVEADVAAGYELSAHLHNHPFMFGRKVGDRMWTTKETLADVGGAVAPSMTDVQFYRNLLEEIKLRAVWVTNGIHTARFGAEEIVRLSAAQ